jgi:hypothetical protein
MMDSQQRKALQIEQQRTRVAQLRMLGARRCPEQEPAVIRVRIEVPLRLAR